MAAALDALPPWLPAACRLLVGLVVGGYLLPRWLLPLWLLIVATLVAVGLLFVVAGRSLLDWVCDWLRRWLPLVALVLGCGLALIAGCGLALIAGCKWLLRRLLGVWSQGANSKVPATSPSSQAATSSSSSQRQHQAPAASNQAPAAASSSNIQTPATSSSSQAQAASNQAPAAASSSNIQTPATSSTSQAQAGSNQAPASNSNVQTPATSSSKQAQATNSQASASSSSSQAQVASNQAPASNSSSQTPAASSSQASESASSSSSQVQAASSWAPTASAGTSFGAAGSLVTAATSTVSGIAAAARSLASGIAAAASTIGSFIAPAAFSVASIVASSLAAVGSMKAPVSGVCSAPASKQLESHDSKTTLTSDSPNSVDPMVVQEGSKLQPECHDSHTETGSPNAVDPAAVQKSSELERHDVDAHSSERKPERHDSHTKSKEVQEDLQETGSPNAVNPAAVQKSLEPEHHHDNVDAHFQSDSEDSQSEGEVQETDSPNTVDPVVVQESTESERHDAQAKSEEDCHTDCEEEVQKSSELEPHGHDAHNESVSEEEEVVQESSASESHDAHTDSESEEVVHLESFHMVSARSLSIAWGEDTRYWEWVYRVGSRFEEVAHLKNVCWLHVSGRMSCNMEAGKYKLSWRLQMPLERSSSTGSHGWGIDGKPVLFQFETSDGQTGSYSSQNLISSTHESRHTGMGWRELEIGEFVVSPVAQRPLHITFFMRETEGNWKKHLFLDGVVVRKSSVSESHDAHTDSESEEVVHLESFHMVSARSLCIAWGEDKRYWEWARRVGSRFEEVAHLKNVCWLHVSGRMSCNLKAGKYKLSWRLQMALEPSSSTGSHGWGIDGKPVLFQFETSDGQTGSYSSHNLISSTHESRHTGMGWRELEVGEFVVSPVAQRPLRITFFMRETEANWKKGLFLDGVVVRKIA